MKEQGSFKINDVAIRDASLLALADGLYCRRHRQNIAHEKINVPNR